MFLADFSANVQRKSDLTNAFKRIFREDSFKLCSEIAGFLGVLGGRVHACARARASEKLRATKFGTCRVPCLLYTSPSPRDRQKSRMPSSA